MFPPAFPSNDSKTVSITDSKVRYFSITKPRFNNISLTCSIALLFAVSAKQTLALEPITSNTIALQDLHTSKDIYSVIFIDILSGLSIITFSLKTSPMALISSPCGHKFRIFNISPIFLSGCSFWYSIAVCMSLSVTTPFLTNSTPIGAFPFNAI